jgi:UDP-N-acetylmuramoylalanine--D-glutamate ligase
MGLGLHGGGVAAARFLASHGATVTVTDLRSEETLAPSIDALSGLDIRYVLGCHEEADFTGADLVVKNPAVPKGSPLLALAPLVTTDIMLFLALTSSRLIAVTGSKGKSTTTSAIHHCLGRVFPDARLGGNITTSPLTFLESVHPHTPVVLELSSWQLADLAGLGLLDPEVSIVLNLLADHQNRYSGMEEYAADKRVICEGQSPAHAAVLNRDDPIVRTFASSTGASVVWVSKRKPTDHFRGAWFDGETGLDNLDGEEAVILEGALAVPGDHTRHNLLFAALALGLFGVDRSVISPALCEFGGIRHRLEPVATKRGIRFVNDSAATIPDATVAAVGSYPEPVHLIAGGTDKKLDFAVLDRLDAAGVHLLAGSATDGMIKRLESAGIAYAGPFSTLEEAFASAVAAASPGSTVLFSPGCSSFELFLNEFDRGDRFVDLVKKLPDEA